MTPERSATLEKRLQAQMYLAESGWRVRSQWQRDGDHLWEVFFAVHDLWPEQRALTLSELVKRCAWQESYRPPQHGPNA